ncbi:TetR/AcrR family transcriptional regulator [Desulfitobacterium hafniense]|uniref:TetR/AcrR family transcriptional regulator n=1 Tax=Desulfitobacterium hafniense TaxID=49338 RepID=UPI00037DFEC7|nr:TetR/AcrR family transcriptional regulator [Desulfitobacterium hafniense]
MKNEQRKALTKLTIEQAATRLFSQSTYEAVSMNEIAKEAGISKRTVYKYFPSKYALLSSVFERYQQNHHAALVKALSQRTTPKEKLTAAIQTTYHYTSENLSFMKLLWAVDDEQSFGDLPAELYERILGWNTMIFNYVAEQLKDIRLKGSFAPYTPEMLVHYISAVNKGAFIQTNKGTSRILTEITPEKLLQLEQDFFLNCIED